MKTSNDFRKEFQELNDRHIIIHNQAKNVLKKLIRNNPNNNVEYLGRTYKANENFIKSNILDSYVSFDSLINMISQFEKIVEDNNPRKQLSLEL